MLLPPRWPRSNPQRSKRTVRSRFAFCLNNTAGDGWTIFVPSRRCCTQLCPSAASVTDPDQFLTSTAQTPMQNLGHNTSRVQWSKVKGQPRPAHTVVAEKDQINLLATTCRIRQPDSSKDVQRVDARKPLMLLRCKRSSHVVFPLPPGRG
eukprot:SAG31_NODE_973_length_10632_cov_7.175622_1_plen_150_part_00